MCVLFELVFNFEQFYTNESIPKEHSVILLNLQQKVTAF